MVAHLNYTDTKCFFFGKHTTVKLRYNVFLGTEKSSMLYPRYVVTM